MTTWEELRYLLRGYPTLLWLIEILWQMLGGQYRGTLTLEEVLRALRAEILRTNPDWWTRVRTLLLRLGVSEELLDLVEADVVPPVDHPAPTPPVGLQRFGPLTRAGAIAVLVAALTFLTVRIWDASTSAPIELPGGTACPLTPHSTINATYKRYTASWSLVGRSKSIRDAVKAASADCGSQSRWCDSKCQDGSPCVAGLSIQVFEQDNPPPWFVWWTELTYTCPCYCPGQ